MQPPGPDKRLHQVVVLGGGFAGLNVARGLERARVQITLVDRRNYHLFQPLLYQVATGGLSPANIASPLRHLFRRHRNVRVLLAEARDLDPARRLLELADGEELAYDTLVVACGARPSYFGHDAWERAAPGLKGLEDATRIRARILRAFEEAERESDVRRRAALLTFAVVGGGPTGVELAGAVRELAKDTLRRDFRAIDPRQSHIVLLEAGERILPTYAPALSARARADLVRLGVEVLERTSVTEIVPGRLHLRASGDSQGSVRELRAETILWAAGVRAAEFADVIARRTGATRDRQGRIHVAPDLTLAGRPEIFVIGDLAHTLGPDGQPLPGVAPVAMQQGRYVAEAIARMLRDLPPAGPFHFRDKGSLATIGRSKAVAQIGRLRMAGFPAWLLWLFVHILYLADFGNRAVVLFQWAWNYSTRNRTARLITRGDAEPEEDEHEGSPMRARGSQAHSHRP